MNRITAITIALLTGLMGLVTLNACSDDAYVASHNISKAADQFEIERRVVFFNGITDKYLLSIEGFCSIDQKTASILVTCKTGDDEFKRHRLGLSDNVSYFSEQIRQAKVSVYHYRVIFKPQSIVPNVDLETSLDD